MNSIDPAAPAADAPAQAGSSLILRAVLAFLWASAGLMLLGRSFVALFRIPLNYNEGWMAYFAERALGGGVLYPPAGAAITNNYPPLSFYVFGWAGKLLHDGVLGGRLVSLAALLAVATGVHTSVRRMGAGLGPASLAVLVFLGFALTFFHPYVAMADPQWLAHALMTGGLVLLIPPPLERLHPGGVILACLMMAAGGLLKHNLLALPAAATLWLALHDRRAFVAWTVTGLLSLAGAAAAIHFAYGPAALASILGAPRRIAWETWPDALVYLAPMLPLVGAAVVLGWLRGRDRRARLVLLFAVLALPFAVVQRLGEGVNVNAYFEALIALSIAAGAAADAAARQLAGGWIRRWGELVLLAPLLLAAPYFMLETGRAAAAAPAEAAQWRRITGEIAATPGAVACELLAPCYWAGKDLRLDAFNLGQHLRAGASPAPLGDAFTDHGFAAVLIQRDRAWFEGTGRLPHPIPEAVEGAYAPSDAVGDIVLMRPKPTPPPEAGAPPHPAVGRLAS